MGDIINYVRKIRDTLPIISVILNIGSFDMPLVRMTFVADFVTVQENSSINPHFEWR